ncbi:MAG TPA: bifunctional phosphopantothenoylcysteine decarboxylase/phosphopantothenate--cysteine ligase CoaBC [Roseiarcus sp.]
MTAKPLHEARILLVVSGGVAAYKALELIRRLRERGATVRVVMTESAKQFVTPLSAAALSGHPVRSDQFNLIDEAEMGHIELSRDADLIVVAPATADLLARMANGIANDLASTLLLATDKRVLAAPAMNLRMWLHPATQRNVATLRGDGVAFVGPEDGDMACGEYGPGRLAEPLAIVSAIERELAEPTAIPLPPGIGTRSQGALSGKHVVVTSGPTYEPIDPVRFIGNRSSGRQGHAIAEAALAVGARVTLVTGPVALSDPSGVETIHVETALQMRAAAVGALPADVFIAAAAVADWRVEAASAQKVKKGASGAPALTLVENPDILAEVSAPGPKRPKIVVGFAAETEKVKQNALDKLKRKGCDLIVANSVAEGAGTFGGDANQVSIVSATGVDPWPRMQKQDVARALIDLVGRMLKELQ